MINLTPADAGKIRRIQSFSTETVCLVRVQSESGSEGWGQTAPYHADITAQVLHRQVAPQVLGAEAFPSRALSDQVLEATYKFPGSYVCRALAGVDTALWDLQGKLQGKSVCELLGAKPAPVRAYGSSMRRDITPRDEAERLKRLQGEHGYTAFKVRVGKCNGHDTDEWPGRTTELIQAVRSALGPDVTLLADGNGCYSARGALEVGKLLEAQGFYWFEEPCPYWELEWTAQARAGLEINVAGGEQDCDLKQWQRIITGGAVDIVQPDVCYLGGLTRSLTVAEMARDARLACVPHSANRSLVTVFSLHLLRAIENSGPFVEFSIEPDPWSDELFAPKLEVQQGLVDIPEGPGWGVRINQDWLERAEYRVSERP
ncbi:MAG TPA: mandelate racemase/muconate lactonizing enzyme family protein [Polyangiaceae bacterium]|jgi:L-alanine-DL-glutamate epimerase-like enolase superfamily enzyme